MRSTSRESLSTVSTHTHSVHVIKGSWAALLQLLQLASITWPHQIRSFHCTTCVSEDKVYASGVFWAFYSTEVTSVLQKTPEPEKFCPDSRSEAVQVRQDAAIESTSDLRCWVRSSHLSPAGGGTCCAGIGFHPKFDANVTKLWLCLGGLCKERSDHRVHFPTDLLQLIRYSTQN